MFPCYRVLKQQQQQQQQQTVRTFLNASPLQILSDSCVTGSFLFLFVAKSRTKICAQNLHMIVMPSIIRRKCSILITWALILITFPDVSNQCSVRRDQILVSKHTASRTLFASTLHGCKRHPLLLFGQRSSGICSGARIFIHDVCMRLQPVAQQAARQAIDWTTSKQSNKTYLIT